VLGVDPTRQLISVSLAIFVPLVGTVAAIALAIRDGLPLFAVAIFVAGYLLTGVGIEVGFHRHFAHRAFKARPSVRYLLGVLGCMTAQGQILYWTANHRSHHATADTEEDPHSPKLFGGGLRGLFYAHIGWIFDTKRNQFVLQHVDELAKDPLVKWVDRRYPLWVLLGFALPAGLGFAWTQTPWGALLGLLWGGAVRLFAVQHMVFVVNSLGHAIGTRPFRTRDASTDLAFLAPFTMGGTLHNTHHAFPFTAHNATAWYTLDPGGWVVSVLAALRLVSDVKRPDAEAIERMRAI
jgi:stearoyl-CoA desaturase (Delta-9 desaturase)